MFRFPIVGWPSVSDQPAVNVFPATAIQIALGCYLNRNLTCAIIEDVCCFLVGCWPQGQPIPLFILPLYRALSLGDVMYMVMLVIDNPQRLDEVLLAWREVGISGATIVESTGSHRHQIKRIGGRYFMGLGQSAQTFEDDHYTIFVIVPDEDTINQCLQTAEELIGDFDEPNTGIFAAWPLAVVKGVPGSLQENGEE